MGPTRSGKSALLRVAASRERPARGRVTAAAEVSVAGDGLGRRVRVASVAKDTGHPKANDLLVALGLWEVRNETVSDLAPAHRAALGLLAPLLSGASLLAIDRELDALDPWAHAAAWEALRVARSRGAAAIVVTDRPETAATCDTVVVMRNRQVTFAGTVDALRRLGPPHELTITTERQAGVRALVSPFEVSIQETPEGLRMEAKDGQELAARLLKEGYGDVKFVVSRPPSVEEGLLGL
jgi:ABC-type multidrug transport system ATPase subunit